MGGLALCNCILGKVVLERDAPPACKNKRKRMKDLEEREGRMGPPPKKKQKISKTSRGQQRNQVMKPAQIERDTEKVIYFCL